MGYTLATMGRGFAKRASVPIFARRAKSSETRRALVTVPLPLGPQIFRLAQASAAYGQHILHDGVAAALGQGLGDVLRAVEPSDA